MISIPNEMLEKYGILPYEECAQQWAEIEDEVEKEKLFCRLFYPKQISSRAKFLKELQHRQIMQTSYTIEKLQEERLTEILEV